MRSKRNIRLAVSIFIAIAMALILPGLSIAGSLEPPASAVDALGNPVPTMTTPPSWSQKLPPSERFVIVLDGAAVLDKETGLVWEKSPSTSTRNWVQAKYICNGLSLGGRKGWRSPTAEELASLLDMGVTDSPKLPFDHPFTNVQSGHYWSATTAPDGATAAIFVDMQYSDVGNAQKINTYYVWCVRGGHGYDAY